VPVSDRDQQQGKRSRLGMLALLVVLIVAEAGILSVGFGDPWGMCFAQEGSPQDVVRLPPVPNPPQPGLDANAAPDQNVRKPPEPAAKPEAGSNGDRAEQAAKEKKEKDKEDVSSQKTRDFEYAGLARRERQWLRANRPLARDGSKRCTAVSIGYVSWAACRISSGKARISCSPRMRS
jgi:hypothetical protein